MRHISLKLLGNSGEDIRRLHPLHALFSFKQNYPHRGWQLASFTNEMTAHCAEWRHCKHAEHTEKSRIPGHYAASLLSPWGTSYCDDSICWHGNRHRTRVLRYEMVASVLLYRSPNATTALKKKRPSGVTTTELKNDNYIWLYRRTCSLNMPRYMPSLSDVVSFLRSIVVLTPKGQFLDCATPAFSERYLPFTA